MVTNQPQDGHQQEGSVLQTSNLALRLNSQNQIQLTTAMDGQLSMLSSLGWSATNPRMVTHQKKVYYILGIWHLYLSHKTSNRYQLYWMFTDRPQDGLLFLGMLMMSAHYHACSSICLVLPIAWGVPISMDFL